MVYPASIQTEPGTSPRLSDTQLAMYARDGFLLLRAVFGAQYVSQVRDAFDRLHAKSQTLEETCEVNGSLFVIGQPQSRSRFRNAALRVVWTAGDEPVLARLGADPNTLSIARAILQTNDVVQLINQAHFKHPFDGVEFPWHQDSKHRRQGTDLFTDIDGRGSFVETLTAVDPMADDNGPLEVLVGSHKEGHLGSRLDAELQRAIDQYPAKTVNMAPGDMLLVSPFLIHRSLPNQGHRSRYVFLNGFALPGASRRIYPGCGLGRLHKYPPK